MRMERIRTLRHAKVGVTSAHLQANGFYGVQMRMLRCLRVRLLERA
ncbi:hypothetical protein ACVW1A_004859 [Bradyrhizobium sp. LB1.3]